jgi:NAD(P)-dependent dehydrogenase (short-subunit alcohol dehydrogenase family)
VTEVLDGASALVTGGAGGIGSASALLLARDGATVTVMGRTTETLARTVARIEEAVPGAIVRAFVGDATRESDVAAAIGDVVATTGRLDVCVSTVGRSTIAPLLALDEDRLVGDWRHNFLSAFLVIRHGAAPMADAGGGSVVCVSSVAAVRTSASSAHFDAA